MARFYAEIQGNRGVASRMGTEASGMCAHIRGWSVGCRVRCFVGVDGKDVITVYRTGGSSGEAGEELLTVLREEKDSDELE